MNINNKGVHKSECFKNNKPTDLYIDFTEPDKQPQRDCYPGKDPDSALKKKRSPS